MEPIHSYPMIGELNADAQKIIQPFLTTHEFAVNEVVLQQGQEGADFHIIVSGILDVFVEKKAYSHLSKTRVATLTAGQFFGEMSCLAGHVVSATVQAREAVTTVSLTKEGMLLLMEESAPFRKRMMAEMIHRLEFSNTRVVEEHSKSLAALKQLKLEQQTKYGELVGESPFIQEIKETIQVQALNKKPLCLFGESGVGKTHIAWEIHKNSAWAALPVLTIKGASFTEQDWFEKTQMASGGMVILEQADLLSESQLQKVLAQVQNIRLILTASEPTQIAKFDVACIEVIPLRERKSDIPIYIAHFIQDAGFSSPETLFSQEVLNLLQNFPFLHANLSELKNVVLDALIRSHGHTVRGKHLRFGSPRKAGARPLIGLALGSGSIKGVAHVGVLKALEEANIPIDLIAGTSAGALVGSIYAGGTSVATFEKVLPSLRWRDLVRFTLPRQGIVNNFLMSHYIEKYIGKAEFKDLKIPFAAIASDAINGEAIILNTGRVSHAVCASTAIPGVMHPVTLGGRIMLDGAVAQPVPVALAKSMGADIVIAVDVSTPQHVKKSPKNFIGTILNTIDIMSERIVNDELQLADVVIKPWLANNQLNFKESLSYIERGYEVTKALIPEIQQKIEQYKLDAKFEA